MSGSESSSALCVGIQDAFIPPEDLGNAHKPKPRNHPTRPGEDGGDDVQRKFACPAPSDSRHLSEALGFDGEGMLLPHSILGSLDAFRRYLEARGETQLVKRLPASTTQHSSHAVAHRHRAEAAERKGVVFSAHSSVQANALQHWHTRMKERRRQQDVLSGLIHRPVQDLLMSQSDCFRELQEQREFLSQVLPQIQSGYGHRVGSEFWNMPSRYGDEMSGISATLTQTEQGKRQPVTLVGRPDSIRQEAGNCEAESLCPTPLTWKLWQQRSGLGGIVQEMAVTEPDIRRLEVIGSAKPPADNPLDRGPSSQTGQEDQECTGTETASIRPLTQCEDTRPKSPLVPALRFGCHLASWTGNTPSHQGEVGINATILFEALAGGRAVSHLELTNVGNTSVSYSWQRLRPQQSFPHLHIQTNRPHFYFNSSSGMILPGDSQQVEFIFKSERPGIETDVWQLNTHPLLLQGASLQITLRGVSLCRDTTAQQRQRLQAKLEKAVAVKVCRSVVEEVVWGVHTPEGRRSPAELLITDEQQFLRENPTLQYQNQPVAGLEQLWEEVAPGDTWDLSVDTLRQKLVSAQDAGTREERLSQFNSLLLELCEPSAKPQHLTVIVIGKHLWRRLLDMMADEALALKQVLNLQERPTTGKHDQLTSDPDVKESTGEKTQKHLGVATKEGKNVKSKESGRVKHGTTPMSGEDRKGREKKRRDDTRKQQKKEGVVAHPDPESESQQLPEGQIDKKMLPVYRRRLHQKVYVLVGDLVDKLCDLLEEQGAGFLHESYEAALGLQEGSFPFPKQNI